MSVYPYLSVGNYGVNSIKYKLLLTNKGVGPAIVKSVKVTAPDGRKYTDIVHYVKDNLTKKDSVSYYYANISEGRLISEKEEIEIIVVHDNKLSSSQKLFEILTKEGVYFEIEYESIYGEKWRLTNESHIPSKIK